VAIDIPSTTTLELENDKFAKNKNDKIIVRTEDEQVECTLQEILTALGGTANTTPSMFNVSLGIINTEQSQALPASTKEFIVRTRGAAELKLAFVASESGTKYITIPRRATFTVKQFFTSQTLYFQSPQTGDVVEILAFT